MRVANTLLLASATLLACVTTEPVPTPPPADPPPDTTSSTPPPATPEAPSKPRVESTLDAQGLSLSALDRAVDPCVDFYQFACGGWEKTTSIPDDRSRWSRSFSEIDLRNEETLKTILEASAQDVKKPAKGKKLNPKSPAAQIGRFYASCMDMAAIDRAGVKPLKPLLDAASSVDGGTTADPARLTKALVTLHKHSVWAFFDVSSGQDFKDATKMIGVLDQNGLGLPDRDYYLKHDDADKKGIYDKYAVHVERMFVLAGFGEVAKASTADVLRIETALATISKSREERRDPQTMYNKIDRSGLETKTPTVDWKAYWKGLGFAEVKDITVSSPKFFEGIDALFKSEKPSAIRAYLTWQVIHHGASRLSQALQDEDFAMQQILTGQKTQRERYKRCIDATDEALGESLAQPFVAQKFGPQSKTGAEKLVQAIRRSMGDRLDELDWMDPQTRNKARDKLASMAFLIGYPEKWKTYDFTVGDVFFTNSLAGTVFRVKDTLSKIGKPVDRGEWYMTPPTVNAYYDPQKNQMVFPAGILQPPFYNDKASDVVNLGAMGMVVGHELTHGFDDEGAQFDRDGNLSNWWSDKTNAVFKQKGTCVEKQYADYEVLPGLHLNGKLTLGENIADAGGVKLAFRAYRTLREPSPTETVADGFTEDQQFFLSVGQIWCSKYRDQTAKLMVQTDPHSHPRYRVNGPLSHLPDFARAFGCKPASKMMAKDACTVW